jgi:hypothetical protein
VVSGLLVVVEEELHLLDLRAVLEVVVVVVQFHLHLLAEVLVEQNLVQ